MINQSPLHKPFNGERPSDSPAPQVTSYRDPYPGLRALVEETERIVGQIRETNQRSAEIDRGRKRRA